MRYDLSWQALDGALARRAVVARAVAVDAYGGGPDGKRLATLADAAERAPRTAREAAENELVRGAGSRRPGVAAGGAGCRARRCRGAGVAGPSLPQRRRPRHPGAAGTARGARSAPRRNRRAANLFRDRRTRGGVADGRWVWSPAGVGTRRAARRRRLRAAVLRVRPGERRRLSAAVVVHRRRGRPTGRDAGRGGGARTGGGDGPAGRPGRRDRTGVAARCGHRFQRLGHPQRGDVLRAPHPAVRAVDGRAHRAGAGLHPRPPLVRCDNDWRAGREG